MAYHPRHGAGQLPLTPPDSGSGYGYSNIHYSQKPYPAMNQPVRHDTAYEYHQAYMPQQLAPIPPQYSSTYSQSLYQSAAAAAASMTQLPPISNYYEPIGAPILPPLRTQERLSFGDDFQRISQYDYSRGQNRPAKEEKATGGVSAKLDYEMERMTDFVVQTTQQIFQQAVVSPPAFRKWVLQVLSATRLPSATILLSLHYLSDRIKIFPHSIPAGPDQIYRLLAVALILGSKFLDDNTFINRSWSDVTSIKVSELNSLEIKWLHLIEYGLHVDDSCVQKWMDMWKKYDVEQSHQQHAVRLSPLDTSGRHAEQRTRHSPYPTPYSSSTMSNRSYDNTALRPAYSGAPYTAAASYQPDPWNSSERAPYEDFYKRGNINTPYPTLGEFDNINRRADEQRRAAYQSYPYQSAPYPAAAAPGYQSNWDYNWNVHRSDCICSSCSYKAWRPQTAVTGYNMGTVMG